jgi:hypothetical protein
MLSASILFLAATISAPTCNIDPNAYRIPSLGLECWAGSGPKPLPIQARSRTSPQSGSEASTVWCGLLIGYRGYDAASTCLGSFGECAMVHTQACDRRLKEEARSREGILHVRLHGSDVTDNGLNQIVGSLSPCALLGSHCDEACKGLQTTAMWMWRGCGRLGLRTPATSTPRLVVGPSQPGHKPNPKKHTARDH